MSRLQVRLAQLIPAMRESVKRLTKDHGAVRISQCTIEQAYGGSPTREQIKAYAEETLVFETVPEILKTIQKIKDPWPNVDAASGALLYHFGLTEFAYYTVLFSVSRTLGVCAQAVAARALGLPITRPKSGTTKWLEGEVARAGGGKT